MISIKSFKSSKSVLSAAAAAALLFTAIPTASQATVFTFALHDHPDGGISDPTYGLRLDGLYGSASNNFTFSFDEPGTGMTLAYDNVSNTVQISGRAYGGIDTGSAWDANNSGFLDVDFTYSHNLTTDGSGTWGAGAADLGVVVTEDAQSLGASGNNGSVTLGAGNWNGQSAGDLFSLVDQDNGNFAFKLNNFDDHRLAGHAGLNGPGTFVGWGWVNHAPGVTLPTYHEYSSDWLFTAELLTTTTEEIPEPMGLSMVLGLGFAGFVLNRRRTRRKTA